MLPYGDIDGAPIDIKNESGENPAIHGIPSQCVDLALVADYDVLDLSVQPFHPSTELTPQSAPPKIYLHSTSLAVLCEKEAVRYHTDYR